MSTAGTIKRLLSFLIDLFIIFLIIQFILNLYLSINPTVDKTDPAETLGLIFSGIGTFIGIVFSVFTLYFPITESLFNGKSIGKLLFKIKIINTNETKTGFLKLLLRSFVKNISITTPITIVIQLVMYFTNEKHQLLHDSVCTTYVVKSV